MQDNGRGDGGDATSASLPRANGVFPKSGSSSHIDVFETFGGAERVTAELDYIYGANWSIWLDLKILLRTIPYVLSRRGV